MYSSLRRKVNKGEGDPAGRKSPEVRTLALMFWGGLERGDDVAASSPLKSSFVIFLFEVVYSEVEEARIPSVSNVHSSTLRLVKARVGERLKVRRDSGLADGERLSSKTSVF